ncbi:Phage-related minor tail protein [Serratia liquefaciens]|uniref:tape measure protein n=1 Tax=Serratia liquefaciens TaxID=614 RepID=UPI002182A419|nr:tape measure protein [Serratia liquefaciens]CAI2427413.1 Phage-related minor tail protein [Serratia liquefaciens]
MASGTNEGSIVYQVELESQALLVGQRKINANLDEMEGRFLATGKSVGVAEKSFLSLSRVAASLTAALSVQQVAQYANAWVDVSNKLVNAVRPSEQLADVTQRVFDISQSARSGLEATAALYGRLERATRSAGASTEDLAKLTTTINKGLVVSGATAEEASSTMIQLSQALASGVLRGEEFNSISENGSRIAVALADSLGVTIGQLRSMAAEGKLTTDVVVKGLLGQVDAIAKEFSKTVMTMGQAFQVAGNNITKFVGESTSVQTGLKVFNDTVISLSENIDIAASVVTAFSAVLGGRYVGALALATQAKVSDMLAARAQAVAVSSSAAAAANAATVTARKALLDKEAALSSLALAQAEYNVAKGSSAEAFALENLNATKSIAIQRSAAFAEAQLAQSAATRTATTAAAMATTTIGGLARNALALIGGPAGFAMIAGAALFYFYQKTQQAKQEAIDFADKLDGVIAKMRTMSNVQLAAEIDKATKSINVQSGEVKNSEARLADLTARLENAKAAVSGLSQGNLFYSDAISKVNQLESEHIQLTAQIESEQSKLSQTVSKAGILRAQLNGTLVQGIDLLKRDGHEASVSAGLFNQLGNALDIASKAKDKFNSSSIKIERPQNIQDYLDKQEQQVELQSELNDRKRAQLKAEQDIRNLAGKDNTDGASKDRLEQDILLARQRAGAEFDATKAIQEQKKATKESTAEGTKAANQAESIAQKLENLKQQSDLAAGSISELGREQAILAAQQSLGRGATQTQISLAGEYAAKKWDTANAIKAQAAAEKLLPEARENASYTQDVKDLNTALAAKKISQEQYNATSEQLEQQHQVALAQIRAGQAVTPQQEAAGSVDPVQALANENAKKLALIQQFETAGTLSHDQAIALRAAADRQYETDRVNAQWALFTQQSIGYEALGAAVDSFGQGASSALSGIITGTQSASDAMRGLADTVLSSVIQTFVEMGLQQAKSAIMGASVQQSAIAATTATQVGALGTTTAASVTSAGTTMAAWLPAALVASVGSFGAAAIIGGAALVGAFAMSKTLSGKRKNGGPVSAGSMYQVGEGGMPEIYQASNGSQYMIPGDNGKVISNKDMQGGAPNITLIVQNMSSGAGVQDYQVSQGSDGGSVIQLAIADIQAGGPLSGAISKYHQAPRRATE